MTGAMYAAVAGLRAHMSALNVIGNNISNVNTYGYKATRYTFSESLYTTSRTGSNGTDTMGGRNPAQIGYGCSIGTIDLDMSSKNYSPTAQALDCVIDGDGFFIVGDKTNLGVTDQSTLQGMYLTRLGNFDVKDGYLVDGEGNVVYGFLATEDLAGDDGDTVISPILTAIRLPYATQQNLYDEDENIIGVDTTIYWPTQTTVTTGDETTNVIADQIPEEDLGEDEEPQRVTVNSFSIESKTGCISITTSDDQVYTLGYIAIAKVDSPNGVTHVDGRYYQALGGAGNVHLTTVGGAVQYVPSGEDDITELTVESAGSTEIITGGLESSGTDLANEITNMIMIQRGYQANTRIVTVTDSMLEELVNMKR